MDIQKIPASRLNAAAYNPRKDLKPGDPAYEKIKRSLHEFGYVDPVIWNEVTGNIVGGHQRYKVLTAEGATEIDCVVVHIENPQEEKALNIALNKAVGEWEPVALADLLNDLKLSGYDVDATGFDAAEVDALFSQVHDKDVKEDDFDVGAELKQPCFSRMGDVWHLGRHTVICGDTTLPETFERLLGDARVNLVCTDAPYFVELKNKSGAIANDDLNDKQAYEFLMKCFTNFKNAMAKDASIYEFYATMKTRVFYDAFEDAGFKVGAGLVWKKPRAPLMRTDWKFNMEPIIWGWRKDGKHIWYGDQKQTSVFEFDGIRDSEKEGFDDQEGDVLYPDPELSFKTKLADLPLIIQEMIFANKIDSNGVLIRSSTDKPPYFAVGFKSEKANHKYRYVWLYKVRAKPVTENYATKEGKSITRQTGEVEWTAIRRTHDNQYQAVADEEENGFTAAKGVTFLQSVYEPVFTSDK